MSSRTVSRRLFTSTVVGGGFLSADAKTYRIIDSHVHVWKKDPKFPWAKETTRPPAEDRTPEMLLELMKANGIGKTVIIQVIHYRWDNSYLASVLKQYPQYFHGVARVNPEDPAAPDHVSKQKEQGFRGVRISPSGEAAGDWIKGPLMPPLWKRCEQLKVPMTVLCPVTRIPDVQKLVEKHPNLTVVIDHMADCPLDRPDLLQHLLALRRYPKVFVKISHTWSLSKQKYPWLDSLDQVKKIYDAFGPKQLMFGTDWPVCLPHATYEQTLKVVREEMKFLNEDDRSWLLSRTVQRVWPFK